MIRQIRIGLIAHRLLAMVFISIDSFRFDFVLKWVSVAVNASLRVLAAVADPTEIDRALGTKVFLFQLNSLENK